MKKRTKTIKKTPRWVPFLLGVLVVLIFLAAGGYLYTLYAPVGGEFLRTDVDTLDLRDRGLTDLRSLTRFPGLRSADLRGNDAPLEDYAYLQRKLPDCVIRFDVPLGEESYDSLLTELELEDLPENWENIRLFTRLTSLRVNHCSNPAAMEELQKSLPECAMSWDLCLGGEWFPSTAQTLSVHSGSVYYEELLSQLGWFHSLKTVEIVPSVLSSAQQRSLLEAYPGIGFTWPVTVGSARLGNDAKTLNYAQTGEESMEALESVLDLLPALEELDFSGSKVPAEERARFADEHKDIRTHWTVSLMGKDYPHDTETLDFNGVALGSTAELENILPYLPKLRTVEMCDCGLGNEELDALSRRWPEVRFIWNVRFAGFNLRTDSTYFCASMDGLNHPYLNDKDTVVFKYLVDMEAMDLGHMNIADLSFLQYMPKLKYLIIAECYNITDFTPLGYCKELLYLEAFKDYITDLSPLLNCPKLRDLNLCYTPIGQRNAWECLSQMKNLERLWWCNCPLSANQQVELQNLLPNAIFFFLYGGEPSGGSWRYHQNYYDMRDALHMYYMPGGTNGVDEDGAQIIVDDRGKEFHLENFDGNPYWWLEDKYSGMWPYIIGVTV